MFIAKRFQDFLGDMDNISSVGELAIPHPGLLLQVINMHCRIASSIITQ